MSAKVKKVVIQIGQKEITLDVEEAKALKEALDGLFAQAQVVTVPTPYPVPVQPYRWDWPWWQGTLCGGAGNGTWEVSCKGTTQYLAVNTAQD